MSKLLTIHSRANRTLAVSGADFLGGLFVRLFSIEWWSVCHFLNELHRTDDCKLDRSDADEEGIAYYNQTNLAIKGIIAIGAMSKMSSYAGRTADAQRYSVCISCLTLYRKIDQPIGYNRSPLRWMENGWVRQWPTPPHILWRRWLLVDIRLQSICW